LNLGTELPCVDDPVEILDGIVEARRKLMSGFPGSDIDMEKFKEGLEPSLYTMSLSGEATLYPRLGEMFAEIRRRGAVSFLVTNGLNPSVLAGFKDDELPTEIMISMSAPNEDLFLRWTRSIKPDAWEVFNESLDVMRSLNGKVRRAVRLTLVKGENMSEENVGEYVELIKRAEPDFVHVKGFKSIGYARDRFGYDKQVWFDGVKDYALKLLKGLDGYKVVGEDERCCVVVLGRKGVGLRIGKC
jgi:tRNA wybutosine-synthesizing protein 1